MTLKSQIVTDAKTVFLNNDEFSETVSYTPDGSSAKSIKAIVMRPQIDVLDQDRGVVLANQVQLYISTDATEGVAAVKKSLDKVALKLLLSDAAATTFRITDVIGHDEGMWHLVATR